MKNIIGSVLIVTTFLFHSTATAKTTSIVTSPGFFGCTEQSHFKLMMLIALKDRETFKSLLFVNMLDKGCTIFMMKEIIEITSEPIHIGADIHLIQVIGRNNIKYWTDYEIVDKQYGN